MSKNTTKGSKIKRYPILWLLFMLSFVFASKPDRAWGEEVLHTITCRALNKMELTDDAIKALYAKQLNPGCVEILASNVGAPSTLVKLSKNIDNTYDILVGTVNKDGVVLYKFYKETSKIYDIASTDEVVLKGIADDVIDAGGDGIKVLNGAGRQFSLLAEEALGGHSIARHGPQLTLLEMEQRVLGTHPTIPQSRSALRFETQAIHEDAINKAYTQYGDEIDAFFTNPNNTYKEWTFDYGSKVGSGYTNTGTLSNPISQAVISNKVTISIKRVTNSPRGYRLESAFPDVR